MKLRMTLMSLKAWLNGSERLADRATESSKIMGVSFNAYELPILSSSRARMASSIAMAHKTPMTRSER